VHTNRYRHDLGKQRETEADADQRAGLFEKLDGREPLTRIEDTPIILIEDQPPFTRKAATIRGWPPDTPGKSRMP
jgi:hypothetical protein